MKIITILGSPKKIGNTSKALDLLEKNLNSQGHEIERIYITDYRINGCLGCNACITIKDKANCIQNDDALAIFERMMDADMIIYASPLYAHSFPSQMKALIDRHYCLVTCAGSSHQSSVFESKRVALLITCCNPERTTDLVQESFDRIFSELKCNIVGKYIIALSAAPDFIDNAERTTKIMAEEITES
jgi:NAD(P)H-dependent FMN reductase